MAGGRLNGMVALVTGAGIGRGVGGRGSIGPGIGNGIAECLARDGARVAVNDVNPDWAAATVEQLKALGAQAWANPGDVSDPVQAKTVVTRTAEHFGQIDILVNNAGVSGPAIPVEHLPIEDWLRTMSVNLTGPFLTAQAAIPLMRARRFGRIINISSLAGLRVSVNGGSDYTASKAGLLGFTRHLAVEVTQYGITVNAICPGAIVKPLRKAEMAPEEIERMADGIVAQRLGDPQDIGWAVAFLASKEAGFISGHAIPVDGGNGVLSGGFRSRKEQSSKVQGQA